jgi:hypothetical protein
MLRDAGGRGRRKSTAHRPSNDKDQEEDTIFFKRVGYFEAFEDILDIDITRFLAIRERDFHICRARLGQAIKPRHLLPNFRAEIGGRNHRRNRR